ncbi:hypothetical protein [Streptomyces fumanus]|uniref:hypothetical protein n=1 Tax=Streptomyces fumanus TaxID=67302 RepID=UPI00340DF05B
MVVGTTERIRFRVTGVAAHLVRCGRHGKVGEGMAMSGAARVWTVGTAVVAGLASVSLIVFAVMADLDTAGQAASVAGAVVGLAALVVSVIALFRTGSPAAGARSVQAGGAVGRAVTGDRNRLRSGAAPIPAPTSGPSSGQAVPGERGVSAAGDIGHAVTGDENEES